jgi:serine/threonine protein kinase
VKPANLMLTPDGSRVVLMDFGVAKGHRPGSDLLPESNSPRRGSSRSPAHLQRLHRTNRRAPCWRR